MSDLVFVLDAQNRFIDVNYATEQIIEQAKLIKMLRYLWNM